MWKGCRDQLHKTQIHGKGITIMFENYRDVVTIAELAEMLRINRKTARDMLDCFDYRKIGRVYRISKASVVDYLSKNYNDDNMVAAGKEEL